MVDVLKENSKIIYINHPQKNNKQVKIGLNIRAKMIVYILFTAAFIYIIAIGYISLRLKETTLENSQTLATTFAKEHANLIMSEMNDNMGAARTMAHSFHGYKDLAQGERMNIYNDIMKTIAIKNEDFISVWTNWELEAIDTAWTLPYGRGRYTFYREGGDINYKEEVLNTNGDDFESAYYRMKIEGKETIIEPYYFSYTGNQEDQILETSICVPVLDNGQFVGLAGFDVPLDRFQRLIKDIKPFEDSYAMLISYEGNLVAHHNDDLLGKPYTSDSLMDGDTLIGQTLKSGKNYSTVINHPFSGSEYFLTLIPFTIGRTNTPWALSIIAPYKEITREADRTFLISLLVGFAGLILLTLVIVYIANDISNPMLKTTVALNELAAGNINQKNKLDVRTNDEVEEMAHAVNRLIDELNNIATFAMEMGKGNLAYNYTRNTDNDVLGKALLEMQQSLKQSKADEALRKEENEKANWVNQGLAKFSDIMQKNSNNISDFSFSIISNLVSYTKAIQGGLYLIKDEDESEKHIALVASFAYDRRKYNNRRLEMGEGLIGSCIQEKQIIHLTEIPEDFIEITSGLGDARPTNILIVPIMVNEEVFGALEIASFNSFAEHEIIFVQKISENVASSVSGIRVNMKTTLLANKARQQSEELASQEEELRQNMEEMQATQDSLQESQSKAMMVFNGALDGIITINRYGIIDQFNPAAERMFGYTANEISGRSINNLMPTEDAEKHDGYLERYFKDGVSNVIGRSREVYGKKKTGEAFPIEIRVDRASHGSHDMFIGMIRDLSDRGQIENEKQENMVRLQKLEVDQKKHIANLEKENEKKISQIKSIQDRIRKEAEEQKMKDKDLIAAYEKEIDDMFLMWKQQLDAAEGKIS